MSAYCDYCETCTGVCGGYDQGTGPCVFEERDLLKKEVERLQPTKVWAVIETGCGGEVVASPFRSKEAAETAMAEDRAFARKCHEEYGEGEYEEAPLAVVSWDWKG